MQFLFKCCFFYVLLVRSLYAATPVDLSQVAYSTLQHQFSILPAGQTLKSTQGAPNTLQLIQEKSDSYHTRHMRFQQFYQSLPVYGGYGVLHESADLSKRWMNGRIFTDLSQELSALPLHLMEDKPQILSKVKAQYPGAQFYKEAVEPIVYIDKTHKAHWAYRVSFLVRDKNAIKYPVIIVDAITQQTWLSWNNLKTHRLLANGIGFGGNQKTGQKLYGDVLPPLKIMRNDVTGKCRLENPDVQVINMNHLYESPHYPMLFDCLNTSPTNTYWTGLLGDGYDSVNGAFSPSNDALFAGDVIQQLYKAWYGIDALTTSVGHPAKLMMRVHFGRNFANAFWLEDAMTFGDGNDKMYPLVALDVATHEVSHGFTEQHANLEYFGESGGINESFSDMASKAAEFYVGGTIRWTIGADTMKPSSGIEALRYMDHPSRDKHSVETIADYYKYDRLDVHYASGVFNRLFYLLSTQPGWDPRKAFGIMVKANVDYWTPYSTFQEAGCGIQQAAADLKILNADVIQSLTEIGVEVAKCHEPF